MISILLPCYNSAALLEKVFAFASFSVQCEVVCYDNGGNAGARFTPPVPVKWIGSGENVGLNKALNACAKVAKGDYFYLCHSDMCPMPGWDTALIHRARYLAPASFLFCSRSVEPTQGHTPFHHIANYGQETDEFEPQRLLTDFENHKDHSVVTGYRMPFFMHRKLWDKMGGVDEKYFSFCTDDDLFVSAYHAGVRRFWMINQSLVYHLQGKSNNQQKVDRNSNAPYEYFSKKWNKLGYNTNQHIDDFQRSLCPWNLKVA